MLLWILFYPRQPRVWKRAHREKFNGELQIITREPSHRRVIRKVYSMLPGFFPNFVVDLSTEDIANLAIGDSYVELEIV
jgi:hypothetical protein